MENIGKITIQLKDWWVRHWFLKNRVELLDGNKHKWIWWDEEKLERKLKEL